MSEMQKDLVLSPNEYAYVLDETKGNVACNVGPHKMSLSQSDKLVKFDSRFKKFVTCERYKDAIQLFTTAPEGWYIALKNPAPGNKHPQPGTSNSIPDTMQIGCKVNIPGPANFALYPGQMAQVIKGHSLRSNQYLIATVYDADTLNSTPCACDKNNNDDADHECSCDRHNYVNGQVLIIKGTEISFYIPPTGIEVKAINSDPDKGYVRDAVTLERLEYCILKDEDGHRRYVHGPEVVFPRPTEAFLKDSSTGSVKHKAVELSEISGVYVKVIADYKDDNGTEHKTGEELFITGKDQMIYYPRPEHTFITYEGQIVTHAIAIPKGEGRYIMNRNTGDIKTVVGPAMYLPDPRFEVVVKRTLSRSQCELWYPGNQEVLEVNGHNTYNGFADVAYSASAATASLNNLASVLSCDTSCDTTGKYLNGTATKVDSGGITRRNSFTKPRSISLNSSKYDGAVAVDVWTGYAVNVISKNGDRKVIRGPKTILLDYDQTLEMLELSTGKPKTTDILERIAFLRYENNRVSDIINVETSDFVTAQIKVSYQVNFDEGMMDKWFSVDNYVKHLCDWCRAAVKREARKYSIVEFHDKYQDIFVEAIADSAADGYLHKFYENGMMISDVEILSMSVESSIQNLIDKHQANIVSRALDLTAAKSSAETERQIVELNREKVTLAESYTQYKAQLEAESDAKNYELAIELQKMKDDEAMRKAQVEEELQVIKDAIFAAEQSRLEQERTAEREHKQKILEIEAARERANAESMKIIIEAVGPELSAALNARGNQDVVEAIASAISPYAMAKDTPVSDAVSNLLRGTTLESVLKTMQK